VATEKKVTATGPKQGYISERQGYISQGHYMVTQCWCC